MEKLKNKQKKTTLPKYFLKTFTTYTLVFFIPNNKGTWSYLGPRYFRFQVSKSDIFPRE